MSDRGICTRCGMPAVRAGSKWVCPHCGADRSNDPDGDVKQSHPDGYWRRGGARGPDRAN